ncbi:hypothetical protein [Taklimakanibacter deserti]|uniref:hypothetical protein n=1 Tax=Taklimakanibacter deserti TaxID=2267839 RepID=UPI0013C50735
MDADSAANLSGKKRRQKSFALPYGMALRGRKRREQLPPIPIENQGERSAFPGEADALRR